MREVIEHKLSKYIDYHDDRIIEVKLNTLSSI